MGREKETSKLEDIPVKEESSCDCFITFCLGAGAMGVVIFLVILAHMWDLM